LSRRLGIRIMFGAFSAINIVAKHLGARLDQLIVVHSL
jgi:hypothetical protein